MAGINIVVHPSAVLVNCCDNAALLACFVHSPAEENGEDQHENHQSSQAEPPVFPKSLAMIVV